MDNERAAKWAKARLRETGRPMVVAILGELSMERDRGGVNTWRALATDGREEVEFTLVGRRSYTDAEDKIFRDLPRGKWLEALREQPEVSLL